MNISPEYHDRLQDKTKAFLATIMPDGSPQITPVGFSADDGHILFNIAKGRVKERNMRARPQAAMLIQDPRTPYRCRQLRGRVDGFTEQGGDEHIKVDGQTRVIARMRIEHVDAH